MSRFGLAVRRVRLVSRGTSVRIRFGSPFSSKVVVCGHCLVVWPILHLFIVTFGYVWKQHSLLVGDCPGLPAEWTDQKQNERQYHASVRIRFGSPFSSKVVVCGHCLVTWKDPKQPKPNEVFHLLWLRRVKKQQQIRNKQKTTTEKKSSLKKRTSKQSKTKNNKTKQKTNCNA